MILDGIMRNLSQDSLLLISTHLVHDLRAEHGLSLDQLFRKVYR